MQDGYLNISNEEDWDLLHGTGGCINEGGSMGDEIPDVISPDWDL